MFKTVVGTAALILAWPAAADAQILRIGPLGGVSVRVPFVSVDVSPLGGTRVRAPFTAVDTSDRYYMAPGGYGYAPIPPGHAVPYRDFHAPYFRGYHRDYSQDIHPLPPLEGYRDSRGDILAVPFDGGPLPETSYRPELSDIYRPPAPRYHIPSFSEVFPGEKPLEDPLPSTPPPSGTDPTRVAVRLKEGAARLERALAVREEGEIWVEYLRCVELQNLASDLIATRSLAPISPSHARELLSNFEGVIANSSLTWVTRLTGFDDTRGALTNLVMVLEAEVGEEPFTGPRLSAPQLKGPHLEGPDFGGPDFGGPDVGNPDFEHGWEDDDLVPLPEAEELPAPVPDALPDAPPEAAPRPVFRGEV